MSYLSYYYLRLSCDYYFINVRLTYIRFELGLSDISYTLYLNTDAKQRQKTDQ